MVGRKNQRLKVLAIEIKLSFSTEKEALFLFRKGESRYLKATHVKTFLGDTLSPADFLPVGLENWLFDVEPISWPCQPEWFAADHDSAIDLNRP